VPVNDIIAVYATKSGYYEFIVKKSLSDGTRADTTYSAGHTEQKASNNDKNLQNQKLAEVHTPVSTESEDTEAAPNAFNVSGYKEAGPVPKSEGSKSSASMETVDTIRSTSASEQRYSNGTIQDNEGNVKFSERSSNTKRCRDSWMITEYKENSDGRAAGRATNAPKHPTASLTRDRMVAGKSTGSGGSGYDAPPLTRSESTLSRNGTGTAKLIYTPRGHHFGYLYS
jgi:hypothetical protein